MEKLQMGHTNTRIGIHGNNNSLRNEVCLTTSLFCDMTLLTKLWLIMFVQNHH